MKQYNNLINKNDLKINKYTIKGKATIIDTQKGHFVLEKNKNSNLYKYLLSRNFNYFPRIIDYDKNSILFEYLEQIDYDDDQKALDIMRLISLLHSKTVYYKEIDYDEYKNIYENIKQKINYINNYYIDIINQIESKIYVSPSEYLIERNISKIFSCINYCNIELEKFIEIVKNKKRKRVVTLHNNIKLDNLIKNNKIYLISWDKSYIDNPIYDLIDFYNRYYLEFDFIGLFEEYEKLFPLLKEEKILLNILISIPNKIDFNNNEYNLVKNVRFMIDKIYKTEKLLTSNKEETTKTE
ncbi:MAG: hypothetical protein J6O62_00600 [Bacilli bacterium]|nr:hypothetical protein [Bacilli bacterium]